MAFSISALATLPSSRLSGRFHVSPPLGLLLSVSPLKATPSILCFWLYRIFVVTWAFPLVSASEGTLAAHGLRSCSSRVLEHRLSSCGSRLTCCSTAHGIFLHQGSNPCLLHWQADSLPLSLQGSPYTLHSSLVNFYLPFTQLKCKVLKTIPTSLPI